jgi:hypothetical protein
MKDHELAKFVNELTKVAKLYSGTQQLRSSISKLVMETLRPSEPLTKLENKIYLFALESTQKYGRFPTFHKISVTCGVKSYGTIHRYLTQIENKGYISRTNLGFRQVVEK